MDKYSQSGLHQSWQIGDLPWQAFDADKISPDLLAIVKAAALVEYNAEDYATYLANIFSQDEGFCEDIRQWAVEEKQHGEALGAWAMRADTAFDFATASARYKAGYRINIDAKTSIRGSEAGELIARCIVETGTSSYYTVMGNATEEPVLKALCQRITADELRHYKLFFGHLQTYIAREKIGRLKRLAIGLGRVQESEDDELAFAYYAANAPLDAVYDRASYTSAYMARAYPLYRAGNIERVVAMVFRACGITLSTFWRKAITAVATLIMKIKLRRVQMHAAATI